MTGPFLIISRMKWRMALRSNGSADWPINGLSMAYHWPITALSPPYYRFPSWKREGYADYLASPGFDFMAMRQAFRSGEPKVDPFISGFYGRYQLMVQYILEIRKVGLNDLFRGSFPVPELETELRTRS